jgi:hypothetical protein
MSRRSPADIIAQLGSISPELTEIFTQLGPASLDFAITLPDFAAACPVRAPAVGQNRVAE